MKVGYVGIIGRPNVGKSTLINNFLKFKLSIISPKPQTTRHKILGVLTGEHYQVIFLDTPGFIDKTKYELHKIMTRRALETIDDADLIILIVEPYEPEEGDLILIDELKKRSKSTILAINKVDRVKKLELLPLIENYSKLYSFLEIIPISALKLINTDVLLEKIIENLKEGEPFYPDDMLTDRPERFFVAEIIREKLFNFFGEEIPYATAVTIDEFREGDEEKGEKDYIRVVIYVEKDSQKAIVIGKGGKALKKVGTAARKEIEAFLRRPVFLEIWVKTKPKWRKDLRLIKELGY